MATFYAARSEIITPLPWPTFALPFSAVSLLHPNLTVPQLALPSGPFQSGDTLRVDWTLQNTGAGPVLTGWTDRIWLSQSGAVDAQALLLAEVETGAGLPFGAGATFAASADVTLPIEVSGAWVVIVQTDALGEIAEPGAEDDNIAAAALDIGLSPYANLAVTAVAAPALTVDDPATIEVSWSVANVGPGAGITDTWTDRIVLSRDGILGNADDLEIGRFLRTGGLAPGEGYDRSETIVLPPGTNGRFTLFVVTDADGAVFENGLKADNIRTVPGFVDVVPIPYADLVVASVIAPATALSGQAMALQWTVRNDGIGLTNRSSWQDRVFIADNAEGTGRIELGRFMQLGFLAPGGSYTRDVQVTLPEGWTGPTWVFVETPGESRVFGGGGFGAPFEFIFTDEGNTGISAPVDVALTPPPNLIVTALTAPASAPEGSAIDVTWTVRNDGTGPGTGTWRDRILLRPVAGGKDIELGSYSFTGSLQANTTYTRTAQVTLPAQNTGVFRVVVETDHTNTLFEHTGEDDNESTDDALITVTILPRPDLQVSSIIAPDELTAGATGALRWTVINQGPVATNVPNWTDAVYLSLDDKIGPDDILLGRFSNEAALDPGAEYLSQEVSFRIPDRYRGTVYLLVNTDSGNAVNEWPNETNNIRVHELYVEPIPLADLVVHDVVTPVQAFEGTQITATWTVTNRGSGATNIGAWAEQVWLTRDRTRPHPQGNRFWN